MSISIKDIGWGKYSSFEGPYFRGSRKYVLPKNATEAQKRLRVVTATEGGSYDAVNSYDQCIISIGLIQLCEARYFLTSNLLHYVAETLSPDHVLRPLQPALTLTKSTFKKNKAGRWRFHTINDDGSYTEVTTLKQQQDLFLGCSGKIGSWNDVAKNRAKLWAACMANIWENTDACMVQAEYLGARLPSYVVKSAKDVLWDDKNDEGWVGATRAAYLSFTANIPATAAKNLASFLASTDLEKWSEDWCIGLIKQLTFGKSISIYPQRYDRIRPWIEDLWNVKLPKDHVALKAWEPKLRDDAQGITEKQTPLDINISVPSDAFEKTVKVEDASVKSDSSIVTIREEKQDLSNLPSWLSWLFGAIGFIFRFITRKR